MTARRHVVALATLFALLLSVTLVASSPLATVDAELLINGNFEGGFAYHEGCGMVGKGWQCFTNGGTAGYGFYDEMWSPVVWDGEHSQLLEINTHKIGGDPDRYAGIFQTVNVIPGGSYEFTIRGMLRADDTDPDPWRYRVQVGFDHSGGDDWTAVTDWNELPWDDYHPRLHPGGFNEHSATVIAEGNKLTVFVRVWKKWGDWYRELNVNLDGASLFGPVAGWPVPLVPEEPCEPEEPAAPEPAPPTPPEPEVICGGPNLLFNGDFEGGFTNGVGSGWSAFDNNCAASYCFYDDIWARVVAGGKHSQLIEISTICRAASDPDRYAGIYQAVWGLWPGATYELSLYGMIRQGEHGWEGADPYRYRVQWGYTTDGGTDWTKVENWQELPWDDIYPRTAPGAMAPFSVQFQAPSSKIALFFRVWKKWGDAQQEVDVNLDEISLKGCMPVPPWPPVPQWPPVPPWPPEPPLPPETQCWIHVIQRGEYLGAIATAYGTTVAAIVADNDIVNPNVIYVGDELLICDP